MTMRVPTYEGSALSILARITDPASDFSVWQWGPSQYPLKDDLATIDRLTSEGYEPVQRLSGHFIMSHLLSQCCDVEYVNGQLWARSSDIEHAAKNPVTLAFTLEENTKIVEENGRIPMLQFLPLPRLGEWASLDNGQYSQTFYYIGNMPDHVKQLAYKLNKALLELAGPSSWSSHNDIASLCMNELAYQRLITSLQLQVVQGKKQEREDAKKALTKLEQTHEDLVALRQSWLRPDWLFLWGEIRSMAQQLAVEYWNYHQKRSEPGLATTLTLFPIDDIPKANTKKRTSRPPLPQVFDANGYAPIVAAMPMQAVIFGIDNAGAGADRWVFDENDRHPPFYTHKKEQSITHIEYNPHPQGTTVTDVKTARQLWQEVKSFDDSTSDIVLDIFSHLNRNLQEGAAWFFASEHLDHRGLQPITKADGPNGKRRRAGHRKEDMIPIDETIHKLENIWLIINQVINDNDLTTPKKGKRRTHKRKKLTLESRLLTVSQKWYQSELTDEEGTDIEVGQRYAIGWYIRPGEWLATFLESPNYQVTRLCDTILKYDPYRQMWEKRIGKYLMFHGHMQCKGQAGVLKRTIQDILDETSIEIDKIHPKRSREHFETAMNQLTQDQLIDGWEYEENIQLPVRQWIEKWLPQKVKIFIPPTKQLPEKTGE